MKRGGAGRLFSPFGITQLLLACAVASALWLSWIPWKWERTKEDLRRRFPAVHRLSSDDLHGWLERKTGPKPVLLDVRPVSQYDHSRIPGARHMDLSASPAALGFPSSTDASIVICDAVGEDAFPVAMSLLARGYARIQVLEGGIYEWANHGHPLEGPGAVARTVRPGDPRFTALLKRRHRAE